MNFQLTGPAKAKEIFKLKTGRLRAGRPSYANLDAKPTGEWAAKPEKLRGPGIYGLSCKGKLVYVGIYAGNSRKTFNGSVIERWHKHLTYFTMRTPTLAFSPGNLQRILNELSGPAVDEMAGVLGKRTFAKGELTAKDHSLVKGRSCTFHKARFALRNWDIFAPGEENAMLEEMSFVHARFLPNNSDLLGEAADTEHAKAWAFNHWLIPRESALIREFKPICNTQSDDFRDDITEEQFTLALVSQMSSPVAAFDSRILNKAA